MTSESGASIARLNAGCFCLPLTQEALSTALGRHLPAADLPRGTEVLAGLTADQPLFLPAGLKEDLWRRIEAVGEVLLALASQRQGESFDRERVLAAAAFDSFDFHLTTSGPRLIEINTNAGGAFLQPMLLEALATPRSESGLHPEQWLIDAFAELAPDRSLRRVAIVDHRPTEQPLYLDMQLAAAALEKRGVAVDILDVAELERTGDALCGPNGAIDLVYNRLTDFELVEESSATLRAALEAGEVVLAPDPDVYRTFADKNLLVALSDPEQVRSLAADCGVDADTVLDSVPHTERLEPDSADRLWAERRNQVFKPSSGYGSRGVYRGDKISRRKWQEILELDYLAQQFAKPSERVLRLAGNARPFKVDLRVWTHGIRPRFAAARLHSGQVMGLRSEGAGFAPILWIDPQDAQAACRDASDFRALCDSQLEVGA
jgi:hypothetical protein